MIEPEHLKDHRYCRCVYCHGINGPCAGGTYLRPEWLMIAHNTCAVCAKDKKQFLRGPMSSRDLIRIAREADWTRRRDEEDAE